MAQYTVLMSCGHEDTVYLFGKGSERERKIKGFEAYGLCKACYKKKMEEKAKAEGLVFNATVLPWIDDKNGNIKMILKLLVAIIGMKGKRQKMRLKESDCCYVGIK